MKTKLLLMLMLGLAVHARAVSVADVQKVRSITPNSLSCASVSLDNVTITELTGNTTAPASVPVYEIKVMALSASATAYFSDDSAVAASGSHIGVPVYPFAGATGVDQPPFISFEISPLQKFYGIAGTGSTSVMVCKKK